MGWHEARVAYTKIAKLGRSFVLGRLADHQCPAFDPSPVCSCPNRVTVRERWSARHPSRSSASTARRVRPSLPGVASSAADLGAASERSRDDVVECQVAAWMARPAEARAPPAVLHYPCGDLSLPQSAPFRRVVERVAQGSAEAPVARDAAAAVERRVAACDAVRDARHSPRLPRAGPHLAVALRAHQGRPSRSAWRLRPAEGPLGQRRPVLRPAFVVRGQVSGL